MRFALAMYRELPLLANDDQLLQTALLRHGYAADAAGVTVIGSAAGLDPATLKGMPSTVPLWTPRALMVHPPLASPVVTSWLQITAPRVSAMTEG